MPTHFEDRPLARKGLTSYRYRGNYGWVMIGAHNIEDALREAQRSLSHGQAIRARLQVWGGEAYVPVDTIP